MWNYDGAILPRPRRREIDVVTSHPACYGFLRGREYLRILFPSFITRLEYIPLVFFLFLSFYTKSASNSFTRAIVARLMYLERTKVILRSGCRVEFPRA